MRRVPLLRFLQLVTRQSHRISYRTLQLSPEDISALTQETRALRAELEEKERLLSSTQQLLKIAQVARVFVEVATRRP
jgi:ribosomal protein S15P/S13E